MGGLTSFALAGLSVWRLRPELKSISQKRRAKTPVFHPSAYEKIRVSVNATNQSIFSCRASARAHRRMLSQAGEPLFFATWRDVLMIHFEVDAEAVQRDVPFELDLWNGRVFVSLVAFTMRDMRPRFGGKWTALLFRPIATHHFLNVRTYVRHGDECGIHFMAEWLTNRLAVMLGPATFGLPYRHGRISYQTDLSHAHFSGHVADARTNHALAFEATTEPCALASGTAPDAGHFQPCPAGSLDEWLMERYTAFNSANGNRRFFRVWHPPWPQCPAQARIAENSLLTKNWPWFKQARTVGANFSPGFDNVWMGRPQRVT
jgi:uncharacterized protein